MSFSFNVLKMPFNHKAIIILYRFRSIDQIMIKICKIIISVYIFGIRACRLDGKKYQKID
jgi:hypothetical protein